MKNQFVEGIGQRWRDQRSSKGLALPLQEHIPYMKGGCPGCTV